MTDHPLERVQDALRRVDTTDPATALPHLRDAYDQLGALIDETMASAVLERRLSLRAAGAAAGLSENAVGPRLARTASLRGYASAGRVTAAGVERARYDAETGNPAQPSNEPQPMRFVPRRRTR